jgi:hypothetical protein
VTEEPASYGAVFSGVAAERARRGERIQRALALCERSFIDQFGEPLETENSDGADQFSAMLSARRA